MAWMGLQLSGQLEKLMTGEPLALETLGKLRSLTSEQPEQPSADRLESLQDQEWSQIIHSGYMGIDKDGNLSLFEGPPEDEKVLRTFFQLDVETMESVLPEEAIKQLQQGIRVQDMDEYHSVLSTFSDFAVEVSEEVLQQNKH